MKKLFTLFLLAGLTLNLSAQCPLTTAVDFTATDCHGNQVQLFDILDGGQYVLIDFFYTTCGPCQNATPHVANAYTALGCNTGDVFFMEISPSDADAALHTWVNNYGIEYPTIGTSSGGASICGTYGINAYPTVILIAPDRSILISDLWPISSPSSIVSAVTSYGISEQSCSGTGISENVTTNVNIYPNPASTQLTITGQLNQVDIYNMIGQQVWSENVNADKVVVPTSQLDNGIYFVRVNGEMNQKVVIAH